MNTNENSPGSSSSYGFHGVDSWAVTYPDPKLPTIKFRWTIRNFLQIYNSTKKIASACFEGQFEGKGGIGNKWQIRLQNQTGPSTGREFLSVHLYLAKINQNNPFRSESIPARFRICMLDSNGKVFRTAGEDTQFHDFKVRSGWGYDNFCLVDHFRTDSERLLPGGEFMLTCEIQIEKPFITREGRGGVRNEDQKNREKRISRLSNDFKNLLRGGLGSDFKIYVVEDTKKNTFAVHKAVLAARSEFFRALFTFSNNDEKSITITDFDFEVVGVMLKYLYTGLVDEKVANERFQDVIQIADYYNVEELRHHGETVMAEKLEVENAMDILTFADKFNCTFLKEVTTNFISCHKEAVVQTSGFKKISKNYPTLIAELYASS